MGRLPKFSLLLPENLFELSSFLLKYKNQSLVIGGGTQLIPNLKKRLYPNIKFLISLGKLKDLKFIKYDSKNSTLEIGAMVTLYEIINSKLIRKKIPELINCTKLIAAPPIWTKATIGGNICLDTRCLYYNQSYQWRKVRDICFKAGGKICNAIKKGKRCFAVFSADLPPFLIALDAELELFNSKEKRIVKLKDFYTGKGKKPNILERDEIVTKIILRDVTDKKALYEKFRLRDAIDYPLAGVAVGYYKNNCDQGRVVLNAVDSKPILFDNIKLNKKTKKEILKKINPISNLMSTPEFRKEVCGRMFDKILGQIKQ